MAPALLRKAIDERESPMLHKVQWLSLMMAHVNVVPEKSVSMDESAGRK
jgi:hypothetical protein